MPDVAPKTAAISPAERQAMARRIKAARAKAGYKGSWDAGQAIEPHMSRTQYMANERGAHVPTMKTLLLFVTVLKYDPAVLLGPDPSPPADPETAPEATAAGR